MPPERKAKLRTASDVISRLRWSDGELLNHHEQRNNATTAAATTTNNGLVMMGYTDRIVGPLEKAVKDYVSAKADGDIPEHRILYFRRAADDQPLEEQILWDRAGRVDRIFQSGNGSDAPVAPETLKAVREAKENMIRIEQEQEERRREKAKQRARRARKRELAKIKLDSRNEKMISTENQPRGRFRWEEAPWYIYSRDEDTWTTGTASDNEARLNHKQDEDLVVVTWNVLFDIFDAGLEADEQQLNCSGGSTNPSQARWEMLASILQNSEPDLVSLQEATPAFVKILLECEWIKAEYACSASPSSLQSVSPSGVLLLWNRSTMTPHAKDYALFQCSDFGRSRSLVATLVSRKKPKGSVIAFSSAHLPADKATPGDTEKASRKLARKRELSSILGQFQRLGAQLLSKRAVSVTPVVAGDFNCEDDELMDGLFAGCSDTLYRDIWPECDEGPGFTFDPANNPRAARSSSLVGGDGRSRRIDRIFVGPTYTGGRGHLRACYHMSPKSTTLLGNETGIMTPSDHYGVRASFHCRLDDSKAVPSTYAQSLWAANAPPSPHYMLAVILDNPKLELLKARNDQQSSLPALHVTLLHGFVQADFGCMDLVKSAVQDTLHSVNFSAPPPEPLTFTKENSLGVFEHRASATLVAHPDADSQGSQWLCQLYNALRERFQLCDEQEKLSSTGWNPHVTMGVAGSSSAARKIQAAWITNGSWTANQEHAAIHSVDVLARGASGKFQTLASFPIYTQSLTRTREDFLKDAGAGASRHMDQQVARVLSRLTRACHKAIQDRPIETSVQVVGSSLLGTALPGFSDLDAVVILRPRAGDLNAGAYLRELVRENSYLLRVAAAMTEDFPKVNARLRPGGRTVVLTIRIPNLPSLDLMLCCFDADDKLVDESSKISWGAIRFGQAILETFSQYDLTSAFQGAARIIKLWAHQHDVYGAISGYLGGGGWAVWLAQCVLEGIKSGDLLLDWKADTVQMSQQLVCFFFESAARTIHLSEPITLDLDHETVALPDLHRAGTLSVLAPCCGGDFGRSCTLATTHATLTELRAAASTLQECKYDLASILTTRTLVDSLLQFPNILVFELDTTMVLPKNLAEAKARGCQKFLEVLTEFEQLCDPTQLRPMPKPLQLGKDWRPLDETSTLQGFAWWIGLYCSDSDALAYKVKTIASNLTSDAPATGLHCTFQVLLSSNAVGRLVKSEKAVE